LGRRAPLSVWSASYTALVFVWLVARSLFKDGFWLLWMANSVAKYLFLPLAILLAWAFLSRNRRALLWLSLPSAAFLLLYGRLFLPRFPSAPGEDGSPIRVMTFNVLNRNEAYEAVSGAILGESPDLVGLQELVPANASALEDLLSAQVPYHTPLPTEQRLDVALFSRFPIVSASRLELPWFDLSWEAVVDFQGTPIQVIVVHLIPTLLAEVPPSEWPARATERERIRMEQVTQILDAVEAWHGPALLMCDCNLTETTAAYGRLDALLNDAFGEVGWGFGHTIHPAGLGLRLQRIDYVWHSEHFDAASARVVEGGMSDHNPVSVDLRLLDLD
jgi:endonuclease/exonuclease/phosphatase (EEP) superfamily protein YafD